MIVDLTAGDGRGPLWGDATDDLNLTLLAWPPGEGPGEHVNEERDVVLVILDAFGRRGRGVRPLTYRAASLVLVLEAVVVVAVLAVVVAGSQLPQDLVIARLTPDVVLITALWIGGLLLVQRAGRHLPWHGGGASPDGSPHRSGHRRAEPQHPHRRMPTGLVVTIFSVSALATLGAGVVLERAGDAIAEEMGLSGVLFGATVLALATALPEISTGLQAIRQGDDNLAMSDIFGGNAFLPVLFLVATVISGQPVLPRANGTDIYLTALAVVGWFWAVARLTRRMSL